MRLWSLHPQYLDRAGLLSCWREALLAQAVIEGNTTGYKNHPQLDRFKFSANPIALMSMYLWSLRYEAQQRGYLFDVTKIHGFEHLDPAFFSDPLYSVSVGQLNYEASLLKTKIQNRQGLSRVQFPGDYFPLAIPCFSIDFSTTSPEPWEKIHEEYQTRIIPRERSTSATA